MLRAVLAVFFAVAATLSLAPPVLAQQGQAESRAILVLDASGSMWGQIDGVAKITIAQQVIGELLQSLPEDELLGLTVYGARRKGDCSDIQTLLEPTRDRQAIADLVNRIKPRGKTPMTDAVIAAAEALKYTEEKATVILISDGIETCNPDPCAAARLLEQNGVDFTAHVIGFNVSDQTALTQMQCIADETGGLFRTAANADELAQALQEVAEPEPVQITFRATEGEGGPEITDGLIWTMSEDATGPVFDHEPNPALTQAMLPGTGTVEVLRLADEASAETTFTVGDQNMVVTLVLPPLLPQAAIIAPDTAPAGSEITVGWSGPVSSGTIIATAKPDQALGFNQSYFYLDQQPGSSTEMRVPTIPGTYELRYLPSVVPNEIWARHTLVVTPYPFAITAPDSAPVGSPVTVQWDTPSNRGIIITLANPGDSADANIGYFYADQQVDKVATMTLPTTPGRYEFRLQDALTGANILARQLIEVTDEFATLSAPDQVQMGAPLLVTWEGPNKQESGGDYIAIAEPGMSPDQKITYVPTKNGNGDQIKFLAPIVPGTYELRYVLNGDPDRVLARKEITVIPASASISFDSPAEAGSMLNVTWQADSRDRKGSDYIAIAEPGMRVDQEVTYTHVNNGDANMVAVQVPTTPGTYEVRYILKGPQNVLSGPKYAILAAEPLVVVPVAASLSFDSPAPAGGTLAVTWDGPGGDDYIAIAQPGMKLSQEVTYAYLSNSDGNVVEIKLPTTPGTYELRYVQKGDEKKLLATEELVVVPVAASLSFDSPAPAGGTLAVTWDGPGGDDYIAVALPGSKIDEEVTYWYVNNGDGNTLELPLPTTPGTYEVRYVQKGNQKKILATEELVVAPVTASLEPQGIAAAGGKLVVTWAGPGGGDYLAIAMPGSSVDEEVTYAYLSNSDGNTIEIGLPDTPGTYELRYMQKGNQKKILAAIDLPVVPLRATLNAPATAQPGDPIEVAWQGPGYYRDTIIIAKPGSDSAEAFASIKGGSPVTLYAPVLKGEYEIRYLYAPLGQIAATQPLTIE